MEEYIVGHKHFNYDLSACTRLHFESSFTTPYALNACDSIEESSLLEKKLRASVMLPLSSTLRIIQMYVCTYVCVYIMYFCEQFSTTQSGMVISSQISRGFIQLLENGRVQLRFNNVSFVTYVHVCMRNRVYIHDCT